MASYFYGVTFLGRTRWARHPSGQPRRAQHRNRKRNGNGRANKRTHRRDTAGYSKSRIQQMDLTDGICTMGGFYLHLYTNTSPSPPHPYEAENDSEQDDAELGAELIHLGVQR